MDRHASTQPPRTGEHSLRPHATGTVPDWTPVPDRVELGAGEVHVWRFTLDPPGDLLARLLQTLNPDECRRAERFRTETLRHRFVAGRGGLRAILAAYLDCASDRVAFSYGIHGKPGLINSGATIEFNLAHSHGLALCAVTRGRPLGVDIERIHAMENAERIIDRFFSSREQADFLALPSSERLAAFYRGWSRKEAFLKATGTGLSTRLDSFDVTLGAIAALLRVGDDPAEASRWSLLDLDPEPDYAAALAIRGAAPLLKLWDGIPNPA